MNKQQNQSSDTFLPTKARVMAIIQLCLAFTSILWALGYPFTGRHFDIKSKLGLYEYVVTSPYFQDVPNKENLLQQYNHLKNDLESPFLDKALSSLKIFFYDISPFEKAWMILAVIVPIMALKRREGIKQALWLLPLITSAYCLENHFFGTPSLKKDEAKLFPSEEIILNHYLKESLKLSLAEQHAQLKKGWEIYLIREWARQPISTKLDEYQEQVKQGNFAFTLERIKLQKQENWVPFQQGQSVLLLVIYLVWNFLFAFTVWKALSIPKLTQKLVFDNVSNR